VTRNCSAWSNWCDLLALHSRNRENSLGAGINPARRKDKYETENQSRANARTGAHADWHYGDDGHRSRGGSAPGPRGRVTSTPPLASPAWPPTAPHARCTPPTTARSIRSCASRTARPSISASSSPSRCRSRMRADTPMRPPKNNKVLRSRGIRGAVAAAHKRHTRNVWNRATRNSR
jgi:hypothetical protein